jgi:hypothetical protein
MTQMDIANQIINLAQRLITSKKSSDEIIAATAAPIKIR